MDRPFGEHHKSFTVEHGGDEPAMKNDGRWHELVGLDARKRCPAAHKFAIRPCLCDRKCTWNVAQPVLGRGLWNRKHTGCVHVGVVIDNRNPGIMSARTDVERRGFLCNALTPAAEAPTGHIVLAVKNAEHPWG